MILQDYIQTQASILQLENYDAARWWQWWRKHPFTVITSRRKNIVWTKRLIATMIFTPWIMSGINALHERTLKNQIKNMLRGSRVKKIAITGSYGKTSVKQFLYTILDTAGYAITTPGSFNTYGGIARVISQELTPQHEYFVVELGAYHPGDIAAMAEIIKPDFGIITAIGPQHLERFGSLDAIKQTKFELADHGHKTLVNWDDENIRDYAVSHHLENKVIKFSSQNLRFDQTGMHVTVNNHEFYIPKLFGTVMAQNISLAIAAAMELGISAADIQNSLQFVHPPEHRLELAQLNNSTLIDDTYSSNVQGFKQIIADVKTLPGKKVIVSPGIVELGSREVEIHTELGVKAHEVFDKIIGVGDTPRTKAMKADAIIPANTEVYWQKIRDLSREFQWIVLENDISEQYL